MCVIITVPAENEITWGILQNAVQRNGDGFGFTSIAPDGGITVVKGFGFPDAKKAWKEYTGTSRVFHARIGTSGKRDLLNCHPFACHYVREDGTREERWFFHNGTVAIPRFMDDMNDSWHLAQFICAFPTSPELHKALEAYAVREHSRFVLVAGGEIHTYGKSWFWREGCGYSNTSALANIEYTGTQGYYEGGLLAAEAAKEVVSDTHYPGLNWDPERKLYSNKAAPKVVAAQEYNTRRRAGGSGGNCGGYNGNSLGYRGYGMGWDEEADSYDAAWEKKVEERRRAASGGVPNAASLGCAPRIAPWFRTNWGTHGAQQSYPPIGVHDYMSQDFDNWHSVTMREFNPKRNFWEQRTYKNGVFKVTEKVEGPYEDGLLLTVGAPNQVVYAGTHMSMTTFKELVIEIYTKIRDNEEAEDAKIIDGEIVNPDDVEFDNTMSDEEAIRYMEGLAQENRDDVDREIEELAQEQGCRLVPRIMLNGDRVHVEIA